MEKKYKIIIAVVSVSLIVVVSTSVPLILNSLLNTGNITLNTQELGQIGTGGHAVNVEVHENIVYVVDIADNNPGGLLIINISDPTHSYKLGC